MAAKLMHDASLPFSDSQHGVAGLHGLLPLLNTPTAYTHGCPWPQRFSQSNQKEKCTGVAKPLKLGWI